MQYVYYKLIAADSGSWTLSSNSQTNVVWKCSKKLVLGCSETLDSGVLSVSSLKFATLSSLMFGLIRILSLHLGII